jgi:hypothetical protein
MASYILPGVYFKLLCFQGDEREISQKWGEYMKTGSDNAKSG